MRKVLPVKIVFKYEESPHNREALRIAYGRIFAIVKKNLIEKKRKELKLKINQY